MEGFALCTGIDICLVHVFQWIHIDLWFCWSLLSQVINIKLCLFAFRCEPLQEKAASFLSLAEECFVYDLLTKLKVWKKKSTAKGNQWRKSSETLYANCCLALLNLNWAFDKQRLWSILNRVSLCGCPLWSKWNLQLLNCLNHTP